MTTEKISFASDYMEGAHPAIMQQLAATNLLKSPGYGTDAFTESAKKKSVQRVSVRTQKFIF